MKNIKFQLFKTLIFSFVIVLVIGCGETTDGDGTSGGSGNGQEQQNGNNSENQGGSGGGQNSDNSGTSNLSFDLNDLSTCTELSSTTLTTNTTLSDPCYKVDRSIVVAKNKLLTINPGTVLAFTSNGYITVKGALKAIGTTNKPILFTGTTKSAGQWQCIHFDNAVDDRNELDNVIIEYAGGWNYGALYASGATKLKVNNTIIRDNKLHGFYFTNDVVLSEFSHVTSTRNEKTAGRVGPNALNVIDGTSNFTGNLGDDYLTLNTGEVNSNQTWSALSVPVLVDRNIVIKENKLLTIKPGARFEFTSNGYITVNGALKAVGTPKIEDKTTGDVTPAQLITFSGATKAAGQWQCIHFNNAVDDRNELDNVIIEHAGGWNYGALYASGATKLKINNTIIRDNKLYGFYFTNDVVLSEFSFVTSTNNEKTAGRVGPNALNIIDGTSSFTGNTDGDYITINTGTLKGDQTWNALSVPALIDRSIVIPENKLLTIKAGARFEFTGEGYITIKGALKAMGTATEPVSFRGATKSSGFWQTLHFNNAIDTRNELSHVIVENAGSWNYGAIYASGATVLNLHDSTIQNNDLFGLWISGSATVTNTNNTFSNNVDGDVHQD